MEINITFYIRVKCTVLRFHKLRNYIVCSKVIIVSIDENLDSP